MNENILHNEILINPNEENALKVLNEYIKALYYSNNCIVNIFSSNTNLWVLQYIKHRGIRNG